MVLVATGIPLLWPLMGQTYPENCLIGTLGWPLLGFAVGVVLAFLGEMRRYEKPGTSTGSIALAVLAISYAGLLLSFLVSLRLYHNHQWGMVAVLSVIVIVLRLSESMPSPRAGTVTQDVAKAVAEYKAGKVEFRNDKGGNVHAIVGKLSFDADKLTDNIQAFVDKVVGMKPTSVKGVYVRGVYVSATMSPSVRLAV